MRDDPTLLARSAGSVVFGSDATGYHAARLGYPDALFDRILTYAGDSAPRVVEIGPGTGLATRALLDRGVADLVAVEPDAGMVEYLRATIADRRLHIVDSGFVDTDLPHAAFDLAVAACAFHWIEPAAGHAKLRAIVRRGGAVALWWHSYATRTAIRSSTRWRNRCTASPCRRPRVPAAIATSTASASAPNWPTAGSMRCKRRCSPPNACSTPPRCAGSMPVSRSCDCCRMPIATACSTASAIW
ncbi:MAG: class I SAM-dependent methyltransferase [Sphingomonas sp.]|nr:class I SAM-dependent methyltransferase [Sphingomonas sp.]